METTREWAVGEALEELALEELLAALLRPGADATATRRLCSELLASVGGLHRLTRMSARELARVVPVDLDQDDALRLVTALELGRRAARVPVDRHRVVRGLSDIEPHLRGVLGGRLKEVFVVVLLDAKNRPMRTERVSEGCLTWSVVHPREVYAPAVRESAGAVIVAHNHPSGDPTPSSQDIEITERLQSVGELLGIPLLDHVVIGADRSLSMRAQGWMERRGD